jgi:hypothetical protein
MVNCTLRDKAAEAKAASGRYVPAADAIAACP